MTISAQEVNKLRQMTGSGMMDSKKSAEDIARQAMAIAADICVYTNGKLTVETL